MFEIITALLLRIISNPIANSFQKVLVKTNSAVSVNFNAYLFMSICCIIPIFTINWGSFSLLFWTNVLIAGVVGAAGSICLINALKTGELSVLGPINSYKCIVGAILAFLFLNEIPSVREILGITLIVLGSWFVFDASKEGFSFSMFKQKAIQLRILALFFSALECVFLKKIILMSSFSISFIIWAVSGCVFSFLIMKLLKVKYSPMKKCEISQYISIALGLGVMQLSTNFLISKMNIGLMLSLFQLSSLVTIVLGWKMFNEKNLAKKFMGTSI